MRPRKSENTPTQRVSVKVYKRRDSAKKKITDVAFFFLVWHALAVGRELIPLEHGDAQDVLVQVFDEELTAEVPFRVDRVVLSP